MATVLKPAAFRAFKAHGLRLSADAVNYLVEQLSDVPSASVDTALEAVVSAVKKEKLLTNLVDGTLLQHVCTKLIEEREEDGEDAGFIVAKKYISIVSAMEMPKYVYNNDRKTFLPSTEPASLFSDADSRTNMFMERYNLLKQRISRNELFMKSAVKHNETSYALTPLESLSGAEADHCTDICIFGMISQIEEGRFYLEDGHAVIPLDFTEAQPAIGLLTEGCFVVAEGDYIDDVFRIHSIGFPPAEPRETTMLAFNSVFGQLNNEEVKALEQKFEDAMIAIISGLFVDEDSALERFKRLLDGFAQTGFPVVMVITGPFLARPYGPDAYRRLQAGFARLATLIASVPNEDPTTYVFVPSQVDLGSPGNILPRPPLPTAVAEIMKQRVKSSVFSSNPCRIKYCSQELVVFASDTLNKHRRNIILSPKEHEMETSVMLVKTLIDQATLSPLPLQVQPVWWAYSHGLTLYPAPDLLVLSSPGEPFSAEYNAANACNPGEFNSGQFVVYLPSSKHMEFSHVA